jgi:L-histidine N-alpha-methyltransferase
MRHALPRISGCTPPRHTFIQQGSVMSDIRQPRFIQNHVFDTAAIRHEIVAGLARKQAELSPKYFYDKLGSHLFEAITELPEYYPTRTEAAIFDTHLTQMADAIGTGATLIDLGAGNCAKAMRLFDAFKPVRYVAVDISVEFLRDSLQSVQQRQPALDVVGLGLDFSAALTLPKDLTTGRPVFFYPGSSIGNFTPPEAGRLLASVREQAPGGGLLIGVDLVKPKPILEAAYDDALGVTAAFNRNALRHVNRLIGANFDPAGWKHIGLFNEAQSRIEMHLETLNDTHVQWTGGERRFSAGERIHTECSYKHTSEGFEQLLREAGFKSVRHWTDEQGWFAVFWAQTSDA